MNTEQRTTPKNNKEVKKMTNEITMKVVAPESREEMMIAKDERAITIEVKYADYKNDSALKSAIRFTRKNSYNPETKTIVVAVKIEYATEMLNAGKLAR
jgi:hypothetical protein